jgi:hypothetical protein
VSLSRRCFFSHNHLRLLSTELQPRTERNETEIQPESAAPEKDKLYSRLEIELKGLDSEVMKSYAWYATRTAEHLGIPVGKW